MDGKVVECCFSIDLTDIGGRASKVGEARAEGVCVVLVRGG